MKQPAQGRCPACGKRLAIHQLFASEAYAIRCRRCYSRLEKKVGPVYLGLPAFLLPGWLLLTYGVSSWQFLGSFVVVAVVLSEIAFRISRVWLAGDDVPDPPPRTS